MESINTQYRTTNKQINSSLGNSFSALGKAGENAARTISDLNNFYRKLMEDAYRAKLGRIPGSNATKRLRKKRRDAVERWFRKS